MTESSKLGKKKIRWGEEGIKVTFLLCALLSVVTTIAIISILLWEGLAFFQEVPVLDFLLGTRWTPLLHPRSFGVLPLVCGTFLIVVGSAFVAIPIGGASAIYLSEYASNRVRSIIKPVLEILAGIPTVVYGYFALTFITPALKTIFTGTQVFNAASASIVVGVMILPMVASFVLAVSRAIGETMVVTLAAGATPKITANPLESIQTMTAYIVQVSLGDTPAGTVEYKTIFAVAILLFSITLTMNVLAHHILRRFHEVYE